MGAFFGFFQGALFMKTKQQQHKRTFPVCVSWDVSYSFTDMTTELPSNNTHSHIHTPTNQQTSTKTPQLQMFKKVNPPSTLPLAYSVMHVNIHEHTLTQTPELR